MSNAHCCDPDSPCPEHKKALADFMALVGEVMGARPISTTSEPGRVTVSFEPEPKS